MFFLSVLMNLHTRSVRSTQLQTFDYGVCGPWSCECTVNYTSLVIIAPPVSYSPKKCPIPIITKRPRGIVSPPLQFVPTLTRYCCSSKKKSSYKHIYSEMKQCGATQRTETTHLRHLSRFHNTAQAWVL